MAVYAASKAFVNHFSQAFDLEMKPYGIRVLTICPGMVATEFQKRAGSINDQKMWAMSPTFVAEQIWKRIKRLEPLSIIDWRYRLLTFLSYFVPKSWSAAVEQRIIAKRIRPRTIIKIKQ
jgi:short-subunit dehydrogenase